MSAINRDSTAYCVCNLQKSNLRSNTFLVYAGHVFADLPGGFQKSNHETHEIQRFFSCLSLLSIFCDGILILDLGFWIFYPIRPTVLNTPTRTRGCVSHQSLVHGIQARVRY
jgi:hypothetical protein